MACGPPLLTASFQAGVNMGLQTLCLDCHWCRCFTVQVRIANAAQMEVFDLCRQDCLKPMKLV